MASEKYLPEQLWTITTGVGQFAREADKHTLTWAKALELIRSAETERQFRGFRVGEFAARVYPNARQADACLAADWITWLDCLDDQNDNFRLGLDPDGFDQAIWTINDVGLGMADRSAAGPLGKALADLLTRSSARTTAAVARRLRQHTTDYLVSNVWQAAYRRRTDLPDLGYYAHMRRQAGGVLVTFDLIEIVEQAALPASLYYSRLYQRMLMAAGDVVCWTNDLLTIEKEMAGGDILNLVLVIREKTGSLPDAMQEVSRMTGERVSDFLVAESELDLLGTDSAVGQEDRDALARCALGLRAWMRGHVDWGLSSGRYIPPPSAEPSIPQENLFPGVNRL